MKLEFVDKLPSEDELNAFSFIVDAIFGYSFKGDIRAPFDNIIKVPEYFIEALKIAIAV
jgi:NAD(P)H-hydrate epimerase